MAVGAVLGVVLALIPGATGAQIYQCVSSCGDIYKNPPCDFFNTPVSPSLSFSFVGLSSSLGGCTSLLAGGRCAPVCPRAASGF